MALGGGKGKLGGTLGKSATTRTVSDRHEALTATALGGKVQKGSGAGEYQKADVKTVELLVENKATSHASMSVKGAWLTKVTKEATAEGRDPALAIEIGAIKDPLTENRWIAVPESVMARLLEIARDAG